ncbi:MAG: amino acid adenylation domain-containing protein, partial [Umezawaea sp.]
MGSSLVDLFARRRAEFPERVAVVDGDRALTYADLDRESDLWAGALRSAGAAPGTLVGLCADRSAGLVAMLLGILKTGAAYVPLDPAYPKARLEFVVSDAGCRVIAGQAPFADLFTGVDATYVAQPATSPPPRTPVDGDDPAYVIYTSGSTGTPKGVVVSHHNVVRLFESTEEDFGLGAQDVWTLFHSFAFDFSVWEIWGALLFGGRLVVVPYATSRSPEEFWRLLKRERVTVLNQTPTAFRQLSDAAREEGFDGHSLRLVVFGGERLDPAALRDWFAHHGDVRPRLVNMYGITETTVHVTARTMRAADLDRADSPIGEPLRDLRVHLLDADLRPVRPGERGEIFVGGPGVALGYLGRPELTGARFLPDHLGGGGRLYRSGDLASRAEDGELVFHGRADDQVQLRGFRVELGEVEHALASSPGVGQCAVVLRERDGHAELIGFVTGGTLTSGALRAAAAEVLPAHLVPRTFVSVDALPMTANGKVDRNALNALDVEGRPAELPYSAPKGEVEGAVADIWSAVLGVRPVGRHDPFTALGGDSLHATGVLGRLRAGFEPALTLSDLFTAGTPAAVAALLSERTAAEPARPRPDDTSALSSNQANLFFLAELSEQAGSAYNITAAVRIHGDLDTARLAHAVDEVVARHESLRTGFTLGADGPTRLIVDARRGLARLVHVSDEPEALRRAEFLAAQPFDLARPPLLRAEIIVSADGDHVLVVVVSHLVADGWSLD